MLITNQLGFKSAEYQNINKNKKKFQCINRSTHDNTYDMTSRRKCPYCSLNFDSKYIQRHLVICKNNTDQQVNSSYLEHANVEEGDAVIDDHVHELGHDGGCPILSESVFEEEPDNDDNNNQDTILSDNEFEELLFDEPKEEFNNSNLLT